MSSLGTSIAPIYVERIPASLRAVIRALLISADEANATFSVRSFFKEILFVLEAHPM